MDLVTSYPRGWCLLLIYWWYSVPTCLMAQLLELALQDWLESELEVNGENYCGQDSCGIDHHWPRHTSHWLHLLCISHLDVSVLSLVITTMRWMFILLDFMTHCGMAGLEETKTTFRTWSSRRSSGGNHILQGLDSLRTSSWVQHTDTSSKAPGSRTVSTGVSWSGQTNLWTSFSRLL